MGDPKENDVLAGLIDLARSSVQPATPVQLAQGLHDVSGRLAARKKRRQWAFRSSLAVATVAACTLLVWGMVFRTRLHPTAQSALAYQIEGGSVIDGGYLRESGDSGIKLFFAEGTEFILMPGARGRLRAVDSRGARLAIEQGSASFQVTPRPDARWSVDVGPFLVTVKGTVFTVTWDAAAERFELRLRHGRVSVTGPVSGGEITLRSGQRLVVNLPKAETLITEQRPEEAWLDPVEAAPVGGGAELSVPPMPSNPSAASGRSAMRTPAVPASSPRADRTEGERRWAEAIAAGKWDRVLAEVERTGIKTTLNKASSEDLFALADAARYRRRPGLARQALLAERRRFPDSVRALDASFLLGRIEESRRHGMSRALEWYDQYLAQAPTGTYASEALGRKMIATSSVEGTARAQPIAEEYLRRFPNGTYAGAARALRRGQ
jgi:TolA-binding protein